MSTDEPTEGDPAIGGWVTTKAAAAHLGVVPRTLYRLIDLGELPACRFGRVIRLRGEEITAFIDSRRIQPGDLRHLYDLYPSDDDDNDQGDDRQICPDGPTED